MNTNLPSETKYYFEALKLLKEWSTALVVIQTGALAVIGGILKDGGPGAAKSWFIASFVLFLSSIALAANVVGAIPMIVQSLPTQVERYGNIYKMRNWLGIPLSVLATAEHVFFLLGILAFGRFLYVR